MDGAGEAELGAEQGPAEGEDGVVGGDLGILVTAEKATAGVEPIEGVGADEDCGRKMADYAHGLASVGGIGSGEVYNVVGAGA